MKSTEKPLVWLHGEVKTPPFSSAARIEAGYLLRQLQMGERLKEVVDNCKRRIRLYESE
jgi:hypothetical protein